MKFTRSQCKQWSCEFPVGAAERFGEARDFIGDIFGGDPPPAPDYTPMANASKESAEIMAALGREQLEESKRQYDLNRAVVDPVVQAQLAQMKATTEQGADYYDYMKDVFRPVEEKMAAGAVKAQSDEEAERMAAQAVADARKGVTASQNSAIRQMLRYGVSQPAAVRMMGTGAVQQGSAIASAANQAREKQKAVGWAKGLDVAGMGRGLPGASQGAYGLALNAGNSAVSNQMQPGSQLIAGMGQGASTIGQGRQLYQSGLGSVLNAQGNVYAQGGGDSGLGQLIGMGLGAWAGSPTGSAKIASWFADGGEIEGEWECEYEVERPDGSSAMDTHGGGKLHGPGTGTSDSIPAINVKSGQPIRVATGEYVIPADVVKAKGEEFFDKMVQRYHKPAIQRG